MKIASNARVKKRVLAAAVAAAGSLTLAACTGDTPVAPATTVTQTSSTTPTTTSTAPLTTSTPPTSTAPSTSTSATDPVLAKIPEAARPQTKEGAAAYGRFFVESLNQAFKIGDPQPLDGLASAKCGTCSNLRGAAADLAKDSLHHQGDSLIVSGSDTMVFGAKEARVNIDFDQKNIPVVNRAGETVRRTTSGSGTFSAIMSYDGRWTIDALVIQ